MIKKIKTLFTVSKKIHIISANIGTLVLLFFCFMYVQLGRRFSKKFNAQIFGAHIYCNGKKIKIFLRPQDVYILTEIFADETYRPAVDGCDVVTDVVDLGSHIGLSTIYFHSHFPEARIHCWEPSPDNFALLAKNTKEIQNVSLHQEAISNEAGQKTFLIRPSHQAANMIVDTSENKRGELITVKSTTLKEVLDTLDTSDRILLKYDVEGLEQDLFSSCPDYGRLVFMIGEVKMKSERLKAYLSQLPSEFNHQSRHYSGDVYIICSSPLK